MAEQLREITIQNMRLSTRFQHPIFPLDIIGFAKALAASGYTLATQLPAPIPNAIVRSAYVGPFARKDTSVIDANTERQFVGVSDVDPIKLVEIHEEMSRILADDRKVGGPLRPWFVELQAHLIFAPAKPPLETLRFISEGVRFVKGSSSLIGGDASIYSMRIAGAMTTVDSPNYSEVVIEPSPGRENKLLEIVIIKRNENQDELLDFARNIRDRVHVYLDALGI